jgi:predicted unusual protein kinase regulating ubiquinone biosynthesis (AarF/ABC1/UbiB family)
MLAMMLAASLLVSALVPFRGVSSPLRSASLVRMDVTSEYLASTEDSLEAEFASVKAIAQVAQVMLPVVTSPAPPKKRRKRDAVTGAFKGVVMWVRMAGAVREEAINIVDDACDVDEPEICTDGEARKGAIRQLSASIFKTARFAMPGSDIIGDGPDEEATNAGDAMEEGWLAKSQGSSFKRTLEVWGFLAQCGLKIVKARKAKKGMDEADVSLAKTTAAEFIRDGLFRLGPTFVKLGQVVSTREDLLEKEYIDVLKDLQDNVPGFGGERAKAIVAAELGKPIEQCFDSFETEPIAAASLGQVHRAVYKGTPVAVKVQRAGLKELFDTDLKNLKVLAKLLDKFDPKSDGADRSYADIYDESSKLLYEEIDYLAEGKNAKRFDDSLKAVGIDYVKVPEVFWAATTPRVLTMEFVPSFKLTDIARVEAEGLDRNLLAKRTADAFLAQILRSSYFHCDPHPGNLCVNKEGQLVYYDCGMMNELTPDIAAGFKEACFAIFGGGPYISEIQLAAQGKRLVDALELMGVLAKSADRLSVEKLARYFINAFKGVQRGEEVGNIKTTLGADLQALTEQQVFRFPSTFTFIFRAFASYDGIGKGLDKDFDLTKFAQPFINELTETDSYTSPINKWADRLGKATGLNSEDVDIAISQPRKVAYLEETMRAMETGQLKIRVRSLENEQALSRLQLSTDVGNKLLVASLLLNLALGRVGAVPSTLWFAAAGFFGLQAGTTSLQIKAFDKKKAKYETKDFGQ